MKGECEKKQVQLEEYEEMDRRVKESGQALSTRINVLNKQVKREQEKRKNKENELGVFQKEQSDLSKKWKKRIQELVDEKSQTETITIAGLEVSMTNMLDFMSSISKELTKGISYTKSMKSLSEDKENEKVCLQAYQNGFDHVSNVMVNLQSSLNKEVLRRSEVIK